VLVKLGGALLDEQSSRERLAGELAQAAARPGMEMTVVHGGGKQMTRFLAERGIESKFVNGLRVTTPEILDAILMIFAGTVNHQLVAALVAAGARAVGLTGVDGSLTEAVALNPELGAVGKPVRTNAPLLHHLIGGGYLPVVACVAGDRNGRIYNVNADQMAASCAAGFEAETAIFLTDVEGVLGEDNRIIPTLSREEARKLIRNGVAHGGMRAKLEAVLATLDGGVSDIRIAPGAVPGALARLLDGSPLGTRVIA
jgi:acetylglutamate kinase